MNKKIELPFNPFASIDFSPQSIEKSFKIFDSSFSVNIYREKRFNKFIKDIMTIGYQAHEFEGTFKRPYITIERSDFDTVKSKITVPILWRSISDNKILIYPR